MDLRQEILNEHSKEQTGRIAAWIGTDKGRVALLIDLFLYGEYHVIQRAAWIVCSVNDTHPGLISPYLEQLVAKMSTPGVHVAVRRNVVRILEKAEIPATLHGRVMNICFDLLADPNEAIAVRCFSMTVLHKLSKLYPDIGRELVVIIEDELARGAAPAFRSRAKKILNRKI